MTDSSTVPGLQADTHQFEDGPQESRGLAKGTVQQQPQYQRRLDGRCGKLKASRWSRTSRNLDSDRLPSIPDLAPGADLARPREESTSAQTAALV